MRVCVDAVARTDAGVAFVDVWSEVSSRLRTTLTRRGVAPTDRDDILQEVALRAIERDVFFESSGHPYAWCFVTARNLSVDIHRSATRTIPTPTLEVHDRRDVAETVELRSVTARVLAEVQSLSDFDRDVLFGTATTRTSTAAVRRHRLRRKLKDKVERSVWGLAAPLGRLSRVAHRDALAELLAASCFVAMTLGPWTQSVADAPRYRVAVPSDRFVMRGVSDAPNGAESSPVPGTSIEQGATRGERAPSILPDIPDQHVTVTTPVWEPTIATDDRRTDDKVVCVGHLPILGPTCTPL